MKLGEIVGRGARADVYALDAERVVKLFWKGTSVAARDLEYDRAAAVYEAGLPVPVVLERIHHEGQLGIIYERVHGPSMAQVALSHPWRMAHFGRQLAELHAGVHEHRAAGIPTPPVREELATAIENESRLPSRLVSRIVRVVERLPLDSDVRLCHGDFHPGNIMLAGQGAVIIDWVDALNADPKLDVARTLLLLRLAPISVGGSMKAALGALISVLTRSYLTRYLQLRPADRKAILGWQLPLAVARMSEQIKGEEKVLPGLVELLLEGAETVAR